MYHGSTVRYCLRCHVLPFKVLFRQASMHTGRDDKRFTSYTCSNSNSSNCVASKQPCSVKYHLWFCHKLNCFSPLALLPLACLMRTQLPLIYPGSFRFHEVFTIRYSTHCLLIYNLFRQRFFFLDQLSMTEHFSIAYFKMTVMSFVTTESPIFGAKRNTYDTDMPVPPER